MNTYFYYNEEQKNKGAFLKLPKVVFKMKELSNNAKLLYAILMDKNNLSIKNEWKDEQGRIFLYFSIENIMNELSCSKATAVKSLKELEENDLVEKVKQGLGRITRLYLKQVKEEGTSIEKQEEKLNKKKKVFFYFSESKKWTSRSLKNRLGRVQKMDSNKTKENNNDFNNNLSIKEKEADTMDRYKTIVKQNIDFDVLEERYGQKANNYLDIILSILASTKNSIVGINAEILKSQFLKLNMFHIEYVMNCINNTKGSIKNIYAYIVKSLYQAPMTMDQYYTSLYNQHTV